MNMEGNTRSYVRFDLNLPPEIVQEIRRAAREKAIPPRTLGRMLLVEKVKEGIIEKESVKHLPYHGK